MEKYIYDQNNDLWYELQGDYYIPCLVLEETDTQPIGMWGRKHLAYLKEHRPAFHGSLILSGKLHNHLTEVDNRATEMLHRLVQQMAHQQGISEKMKAQDQMAWIRAMNNIRNAAEEVVNAEVIFV